MINFKVVSLSLIKTPSVYWKSKFSAYERNISGDLGFKRLSLRELLQVAVRFCKRTQVGEFGNIIIQGENMLGPRLWKMRSTLSNIWAAGRFNEKICSYLIYFADVQYMWLMYFKMI